MITDSLGSIATITMGQSPPGESCNTFGEGTPLLNGPTEFGPSHPYPVQFTNQVKKRARKGDILFCVRGSTTGRMNWADRDYAIGRGIAAIRHKAGVEFQPFLRGIIDYRLPELLAHATGSTFPNVSYPQLAHLPCEIPPLAEQRAIAHILGTLDDKIENNRRMNETLEAMAQALFKSWFVDFDPVRAKMEGRPPVGMDSETAALFPDRLVDSEIGDIPEGWGVGTISDLAEINAKTLGKADKLETIEYVEISAVSQGNIGAIQIYQRGAEPSRARRILRHGDTVLSTVRPDRGSYFLCLHPSPSLIASTGFAVITPRLAPWSFIHSALTLPELFEHLGHQADGGAYPAVSPETIGKWQVVFPQMPEVAKVFHQMCGPLYEQAHRNREESRNLAAVRDELLPQLLSGELDVRTTMQNYEVA
ncbi:MAG: hypothetical protein GHCLOJNM_00206 [bacterium]|nr:hypothetical protein [bacterium]